MKTSPNTHQYASWFDNRARYAGAGSIIEKGADYVAR
jgi:hypothetical protein